jgi:hypothetical protein
MITTHVMCSHWILLFTTMSCQSDTFLLYIICHLNLRFFVSFLLSFLNINWHLFRMFSSAIILCVNISFTVHTLFIFLYSFQCSSFILFILLFLLFFLFFLFFSFDFPYRVRFSLCFSTYASLISFNISSSSSDIFFWVTECFVVTYRVEEFWLVRKRMIFLCC